MSNPPPATPPCPLVGVWKSNYDIELCDFADTDDVEETREQTVVDANDCVHYAVAEHRMNDDSKLHVTVPGYYRAHIDAVGEVVLARQTASLDRRVTLVPVYTVYAAVPWSNAAAGLDDAMMAAMIHQIRQTTQITIEPHVHANPESDSKKSE